MVLAFIHDSLMADVGKIKELLSYGGLYIPCIDKLKFVGITMLDTLLRITNSEAITSCWRGDS